jgi:Fe2+ transport system protein B
MSASARLPVYLLTHFGYFSKYQGLITFSLFPVGIMVARYYGIVACKE